MKAPNPRMLVLATFLLAHTALGSPDVSPVADPGRKARFMSLFNVVRFKNGPCQMGTEHGVCLTQEQCSNGGGRQIGNCASGFGTCCQFTITSSSGDPPVTQNCTYVQNPEFPNEYGSTSMFTWTVGNIAENICFIRVDFVQVELSTAYTQVTVPGGNGPRSGDCEDVLQLSQGNGGYVAPLCGTLTGQHMYLDAGGPLDRGDIRGVATFSGVFSRRFRYKFSYIECGKSWSPDQGCQQFYMGFGGVATSYNFAGGYHLNLQHYTTCVRQEKGYCGLIWTPTDRSTTARHSNFQLSRDADLALAGDIDCEFDYLIIEESRNYGTLHPCNVNSASLTAQTVLGIVATDSRRTVQRYCGAGLNCISGAKTMTTSIETPSTRITLVTNQNERRNSLPTQVGYMLAFVQRPCS